MEIGSSEWKNIIQTGARVLGIHISPKQIDQFAVHAGELIRWTRKVNLTTITDPLEVAVNHFLDSIAPADKIPPNAAMLDIGSGGGFPGIPLKIVIPSLSVTLIDASHKKISFMSQVVRTLKLKNIEAHHIRAEDLAKNRVFAHAFDVIVCRALSNLNTFVRLSLPLLAKGGVLVALKGVPAKDEIESVRWLTKNYLSGSKTGSKNNQSKLSLNIENYTLPYLGSKRSILSLKLEPGVD